MDHQLGRIDLIRWQGRRVRRLRTGPSALFWVGLVCALIGGPLLAAQIMGWATLGGALSAAPSLLVLMAICVPVISLIKATLSWLGG
jgi:hypothetical protein